MSFWLRIADRMILDDSRDPIDPEDRRREIIRTPNGRMEAWVFAERNEESPSNFFALKFPGSGGRAERGGPHPCEIVSPRNYEVWTINPPGYGGSDGRASVSKMVETAECAWHAVRKAAEQAPTIVVGNSLGCLYALYVAARHPVSGVFLRNPPPLAQLIMGRYSWWNLGLGSRMVCRQLSSQMDAVENARQCTAPALFVRSAKDRLVPLKYQRLIIDAYGGVKDEFEIAGADHHTPLDENQFEAYSNAIHRWFEKL